MAVKMKIFHNRTFKIVENMYGVPVTLIIGDYDYYNKTIKKKFNVTDLEKRYSGGETQWIKQGGNFEIFVWMPEITFHSANYGTLAHELLHVAFLIMKNTGFKFDYDNTEPINYLFDFLMTETLWALAKARKKKK